MITLLSGDRSRTANIQQVVSSRASHVASASPCQRWTCSEWFGPVRQVTGDISGQNATLIRPAQFRETSVIDCTAALLCKAVFFFFFRRLFRSPLVTCFSFVLRYLSAVIHLQRTDPPLCKAEEERSLMKQSPEVITLLSGDHLLEKDSSTVCYLTKSKLLWHIISSPPPPDARLKLDWTFFCSCGVIYDASSLRLPPTCRRTMLCLCSVPSSHLSNLSDGDGGTKQRLQQVSRFSNMSEEINIPEIF